MDLMSVVFSEPRVDLPTPSSLTCRIRISDGVFNGDTFRAVPEPQPPLTIRT